MLAQCKASCLLLDSNFRKLKSSVDLLTSQFGDLRTESTTLRADFVSLDQCIVTIITKLNSHPSTIGDVRLLQLL